MNIPFTNEAYYEKSEFENEISAELLFFIHDYCENKYVDKNNLFIASFAAFLGRYNFGRVCFAIENLPEHNDIVLFNKELKIVKGDFYNVTKNIEEYYNDYTETEKEDILIRFYKEGDQQYKENYAYKSLCIEIDLNTKENKCRVKSKNCNLRLVDFIDEFEKYFVNLLKRNIIIVDRSINIFTSSSLEKYYIDEETKKIFNCFNYTVKAINDIDEKEEIGELLHIIVYSLWDIADNSKSISENCEAFQLYNDRLQKKVAQNTIVIVLSELKNINYSDEINSNIRLYKLEFMKKCKLFCNAMLDFSGYSKTDIYNNTLYRIANIPYKKEFFDMIAKEIVWSYLGIKKKSYKLIVLDGDETLWDGIISDDGINNIKIGEKKKNFQEKLKLLKEKGILLAICSKNILSDIEELFEKNNEMILKKEDFVSIIANFDSKYRNVVELSQKYNISLENILFIDDSFFECGEMMRRVPEVTTVPYIDEYDFGDIIQNIAPIHNVVLTLEDSLRTETTQRNVSYVDEISKETFWKELDSHYLFSYPENDDIPRIVQLNSRVNRYRLSLDNLTYETILERAKEKNSFVIRVKDKFGDYGIVCYIAWKIEGYTVVIDNWIMSCRLSVEYAEFLIWNFMLKKFKSDNVKYIKLRYEDTGKNVRFKNFCSSMGLVNSGLYCQCGVNTYCNKYNNVFADCRIGKPQIENKNLIAVCDDYKDKMQNFDYNVSQGFFDVSRSHNSRNIWLVLSNKQLEGGSYKGSEEVFSEIEKLPNDKIRIVKLWQKVLQCEVSDYEKTFVSYGGNSILYMELITLIVNYWNIDITKIPFRMDDSVLHHEKFVQEYQNTNENVMIKLTEKSFKVPLFSERFFSYGNNSLALHIPIIIRVESSCASKQFLEKKIQKILNKYRIFRSDFVFKNKNIMVCVRDKIQIELMEHYYEPDFPDKKFIDSLIRKFNFEEAPLVHFDLIHCKNQSFLLIDYSHIIVDGLSVTKITNYISDEINRVDEALTWSENAYDYYDYCYNFEKSYTKKNFVDDKKYWLAKLKGMSPIGDLPLPKQRSQVTDPVRIKICKSLCNKIEEICISRNITEFSFLLSTYSLYLHTLVSKADITIGIPVNCKQSLNSQYDIGQYVNTIVFRSVLSDRNESLSSYYKSCNNKYLEDINHSKIMFQDVARLCQKEYGIDSLYDTIFVYEYENNLKADTIEYYQNSFKSMIDLNIIKRKEQMYIHINYDSNKLSYTTIELFGNNFYNYLKMIVEYFGNKFEDRRVPLYFSESDNIKYGNKKANGTDTIIDKFLNIVKANPDKTCFEFEETKFSYNDVHHITNYYGNEIVNKIGHEQKRILVICDNIKLTALSLISVLKSGNVYIPVSPLSPERRIEEIIEKCEVVAYIAENKRDYIEKPFIECDLSHKNINERDVNYTKITDDAYIIYTSGTTGKSKGVLIKHKGLVNTVIARNELLHLSDNDNAILLMGAASDGYMTSFFSPIISGAELYFPNSIFDMKNIIQLIKSKNIHTFLCTPTMYNSILNFASYDLLKNVRMVALAGESISESLIEKSKKLYPTLQIANEYGPTENSICTSIKHDLIPGQTINAGNLINNVNGMIKNKNGTCCPEYIIGELYLSGDGLSAGYVGDEEYNHSKFVILNDVIWYKTGDLAYWDEKDNLHIVGRIDNQVKINGYRVDLNEIQDTLLDFPGIDSCAVTYDDKKKLSVYYISKKLISRSEVIGYLSKRLNRYMIPLNYMRVSTIPITEIGKTNSKLLDKYVIDEENEYITNHNVSVDDPTVLVITELFKNILGNDNIGAKSNFFEMGGSSIECVVLLEKLNDIFNIHFEMEDIRLNPTPIMLAIIIKSDYKEECTTLECLPFNRFWFVDCYCTAILAVLKKYNRPVARFIRAFYIDSVEQKGQYKHKYSTMYTMSEILSDIGMKYHSGVFDGDMQNTINDLVNRKYPVLIHVDCYYLPYCKQYFQKKHCNHVLTVTRYDDTSNSYIVIDQKNLDSVSFSLNTIDCESLFRSIKSAMLTRELFYGIDYVFITEEKNYHDNNDVLPITQFDEVIRNTILYLRENSCDTSIIIEKLLNYFFIEKEVIMYEQNDLHEIERKEIALKRLLMRFLSNSYHNNKTEELINTLEQMI